MSSPQRLKFLSEHSVLPAAYENLETYGNRTLAFDTFNSGQLKGEVQVFNRECTSAGQFRVLYLLRFSFFPVADHAIVLCLLVLSFSFSLL